MHDKLAVGFEVIFIFLVICEASPFPGGDTNGWSVGAAE